jgi:hypothetical protein
LVFSQPGLDEDDSGEPVWVAVQRQQQVLGTDVVVAPLTRDQLGVTEGIASTRGKPLEPWLLQARRLADGVLLLRRLLGHAQGIADLGPGMTGMTCLVHEVPQSRVPDLGQMPGQARRGTQTTERTAVLGFGLD